MLLCCGCINALYGCLVRDCMVAWLGEYIRSFTFVLYIDAVCTFYHGNSLIVVFGKWMAISLYV